MQKQWNNRNLFNKIVSVLQFNKTEVNEKKNVFPIL